jgi:isoquinoline 1-oxidoreductase beta subunit
VQIVWSRDDDMRHDSGYRPASHHALRGALGSDGNVVMFYHKMAKAAGGGDDDVQALTGSGDEFEIDQAPPYGVPGRDSDSTTVRLPIPTGAWRSVDATQICFANECFMDELAHAAGADPYAFRRQYLGGGLRGVLDLAAQEAGWDSPVPDGVGRGIACYSGFGSYAAHVVEVSVSNDGIVRVHKVVAAIDCGFVVNPSGASAQVEGAISDGLSTALKAGINIKDGGVSQSSYADYEWLRIDEMPVVEVHFVPTPPTTSGDDVRLGGLGEPGFPSVSPALANAIFDLTGRRLRRLPIRPEDLEGWMGAVTPTATSPRPTDTPTSPPSATPTVPPTSPPADDNDIFLPKVIRG